MTPVARIRDAELYRQQRIWTGETVIASEMALHVRRLGHMAINAPAARFPGRVKGMIFGNDRDRSATSRRSVALQAELISVECKSCLARVRIVAIEAGDTAMCHPAHQEGAVFKILL